MLTKKIREKGSLLGKIEFAGQPVAIEDPNLRNLVAEVSLKVPRVFNAGKSPRIVAVDCGIKNNIIRCLCQQEVQVTVVPFDYDLKAHAAEYDGIFISNGPGNPEMAQATIEQLKWAITTDIPIFGICLGNQLLALAAGEIAEEKRRRVTEQLLYHLGRWIYLTDAADDLRSDMKTGSYNPLALRFAPEDGRLRPADRQALAQTMDGSVQAMAAAFELLPESVYTPVLRATVYEGLYAVGAAVLNGTFRKRQRRKDIGKADTDYA